MLPTCHLRASDWRALLFAALTGAFAWPTPAKWPAIRRPAHCRCRIGRAVVEGLNGQRHRRPAGTVFDPGAAACLLLRLNAAAAQAAGACGSTSSAACACRPAAAAACRAGRCRQRRSRRSTRARGCTFRIEFKQRSGVGRPDHRPARRKTSASSCSSRSTTMAPPPRPAACAAGSCRVPAYVPWPRLARRLGQALVDQHSATPDQISGALASTSRNSCAAASWATCWMVRQIIARRRTGAAPSNNRRGCRWCASARH